MDTGIYSITCKVNNKMYVGYATSFNTRWPDHRNALNDGIHYNYYLQQDWALYGAKMFKIERVEVCTEDRLVEREHYWATLLNVHNREYGYNIRPTGESKNVRLAQETKDKISKAQKGKVRTSEQLIKRTATRKKNAEKRGYWVSPERIEKMKIEMKGKPISPNMVKKSIEKSSKKCSQYSLQGNLIAVYNSQCEAGRQTGIDDSGINAVCIGKISTSGGYVWRSENDPFNKYPVILEKPLPNNTKAIVQYTKEGKLIKEYRSLRQAEKETGICTMVMRIQANGKMKTTQNVKYIWKWKT
jgi:group I intron endonuclease